MGLRSQGGYGIHVSLPQPLEKAILMLHLHGAEPTSQCDTNDP